MAVNPFGFRTGPVTFWLIVVYAAFLIPLVWIHETIPSIRKEIKGLNVTEAWHDLTTITRQHHPYNSRANEDVGEYLLLRINEILFRNNVSFTFEKVPGGIVRSQTQQTMSTPARNNMMEASKGPLVTIFDDTISNVSYASSSGVGTATYFEGTNKIVYVRGTEDEDFDWWNKDDGRSIGKGGVLVNAHYDSVSTGYGATDDGMGCVSILQMLNYYTIQGNQPTRGIVLLLNNGEEDGLLGAEAYLYSPLYHFTTTFVNLEGAGAGGRAILFRASDLETVRAYEHVRHPFGSVVAQDGFKMGLVRSDTDYTIWTKKYGQRGLDIAFYRPRARYHTDHDDTRHTSQESLWHMLSNSFEAVETLQKEISTFNGRPQDGDKRKVSSGSGTEGVWFDMFGLGFATLALRGLFAWTLTLLIVTPLVLFLVSYLLARNGKYYFFSGKVKIDDDGEFVSVGGWRGFSRFPLAFIVSAGLTIACALLINKINPQIIHSSDYAVWATFLSLNFASFWNISRGASAIRPSALQRGYASIWLFVISWALLVVVTVYVDRMKIASGYVFAFLHSAIFVAALISLLDLFALPTKEDFARTAQHDQQTRDNLAEVPNSDDLISSGPNESAPRATAGDQPEEPTETSALLSGENENHGTLRTTFTSGYRRSISAVMQRDDKETEDDSKSRDKEQPWAHKLPSWTWLLQLLALAPITLIIYGQVGLVLTAAIQSISSDGMNSMPIYLMMAVFSIVILLPVTPFIHRTTFYLPLFLLFVFIISLFYNLFAFPFSANNRLKVRFSQVIDLSTGSSGVHIVGIEEYVRKVISDLPFAAGQTPQCKKNAQGLLSDCVFDGAAVPPKITDNLFNNFSMDKYVDLVTVNVSRPSRNKYEATLDIDAEKSKHCVLAFHSPITRFSVRGNPGIESLLGAMPDAGVRQISLWRRDWSKPWTIDIEWDGSKDSSSKSFLEAPVVPEHSEELRARQNTTPGITGAIRCDWSDANVPGTIPAFDEVLQYAPDWIAVTKATVGLVQGEVMFGV